MGRGPALRRSPGLRLPTLRGTPPQRPRHFLPRGRSVTIFSAMIANAMDSISARVSTRRYDPAASAEEALDAFRPLLEKPVTGPWGTTCRFRILDGRDPATGDVNQLATYGMIEGARYFLAGALRPGPGASEDFGWAMEGLVLEATARGLGTCWLGGTLDRRAFAGGLELAEDEVLGAASPLGIPAARLGMRNRLIRGLTGADQRRPFPKWVFCTDDGRGLDEHDLGNWLLPLAALRRAPSASNKQPWRVVGDPETGIWHFFVDEVPAYNRRFAPVYLQNMDLGIGLRHFYEAATAQKLPGTLQPVVALPETPAAVPRGCGPAVKENWLPVAVWKP